VDEVLVIARLVHFASAMAAFGAAAFAVYAVDISAEDPQADAAVLFDRWNMRVVRVSAVVVLVSGLAIVPFVAVRMAGAASAALDPATIATVLSETEFGRVWCWHLLLAALLILSAAMAAHRRVLNLVWGALAFASAGWVGHVAAASGWAGLGRGLNQSVHLLAAGLWLGGLLPLGRLLGRGDEERFNVLASQALPAFSHMGYGAVAAIAITGAVNTLILAGSFAALSGTDYGRLLSLKILLYLAMVAIALRNRFRLMPRFANRDARASRALYRSVLIEQAVGLGILAVVSVLGTWPPPVMHHH
jgi:putative copper resistance protein D